MKKYVSVHYENFKSSSEISHNMRTQKEPTHLLKLEDRFPNVLDSEAKNKYDKLLKEAKKQSPRSFQKTAKPNVDMVMSWSWEQVKLNIEKYGIEKYNEMIKSRVEDFGNRIEKEFGLKYVSMNLHNDEGHYNKNNEVELNQHSHITFLDFDFNKKKRVIRTLSKYDLKKWQQISEDCFQDLDFEQGKNKNKQKHIKDFGEVKERLNNEVEDLENDIKELTLEELEELKIKYKNDKLKKRLIDYAYRAKSLSLKEYEVEKMEKYLKNILSTWNKVQADEKITPEEQVEFQKILKASKYKTADKNESKKIKSSLSKK